MSSPATIYAASTHCPPPPRPWLGRQSWTDMLLVHWALPVAALQPYLPRGLEADTHTDSAWLSIVAYQMGDVRLRGMPRPLGRTFAQLNLRTYVRCNGRAGIYFLSLDAADGLATAVGRLLTGLPYHRAKASLKETATTYAFCSRRARDGVGFEATYVAGEQRSEPSALDVFLTERYVFYAAGAGGQVTAGEVRHRPWSTGSVQANLGRNDLAQAFPTLQRVTERPPDHVQFSGGVNVLFWRPVPVALTA